VSFLGLDSELLDITSVIAES